MSAYCRDFDETKYISFLIKDDEFFEKYNTIWEINRSSEELEQQRRSEIVSTSFMLLHNNESYFEDILEKRIVNYMLLNQR